MAGIRAYAYFVLILSVLYYRNGSALKNSIFLKSPLPEGYLAGGDSEADCKDIGSSANPELASCEDAAFWDLHDASGKLTERKLVLGCDRNRPNWNTVMGPLRDPNPIASLWLYTDSEQKTSFVSTIASTQVKAKAASILDKIRNAATGKVSEEPQVITKSVTETTGPNLRRLELKNYPKGHDFHPLGLEIWPSYDGNSSYLYAINHARARTVIEQFILDPSDPTAATHIRTISHSWFISPNSLALTSPDSFYVSNDHLFTRRLPIIGKFVPMIETLLGLPFSFVAHVTLNPPSSDTSAIAEHTIEAPFIPFANGVSLSPGGGQVAIASTSLNSVLFYNRDKATNKLSYKSAVTVPFCPDNIRYYAPESHNDETASLIVAGHPHFPSVVKVAANEPGAVGQSWILSITRQSAAEENSSATVYDTQAPFSASEKVPLSTIPKEYSVETIFQSNGTRFSTSATGLKDSLSGAVYVTGLYAPQGAMVCKPSKSD
ncbi:hypothetical protein AGABI1DRAFT_107224 [Agaricus bisporus var. burnettii JB137-S8]|uniref:Arylesterase n=1 Tax=Agaricus bisporus var. burnettii (strain JB137-S8 / ATCC MYA-4627 / FGSC 10392) TaxID=597362 RepID=K5VW75_AGABU|nr:uncharacterized protein AGABI1DRAFT_107224 [Agaricus bisporus var. burnettii JB137-S8]EKM78729.1 hypothetical protein AGABI1DRAFT_107224 [Agaricus bisporus var. burnettii JB137-S8]